MKTTTEVYCTGLNEFLEAIKTGSANAPEEEPIEEEGKEASKEEAKTIDVEMKYKMTIPE